MTMATFRAASMGACRKCFKIAVKKIHSSLVVADQFKFVENITRKGFFFYLLSNIPLQKIMRGVIFFLDTKLYKGVDLIGNFYFMRKDRLEYFMNGIVSLRRSIKARN